MRLLADTRALQWAVEGEPLSSKRRSHILSLPAVLLFNVSPSPICFQSLVLFRRPMILSFYHAVSLYHFFLLPPPFLSDFHSGSSLYSTPPSVIPSHLAPCRCGAFCPFLRHLSFHIHPIFQTNLVNGFSLSATEHSKNTQIVFSTAHTEKKKKKKQTQLCTLTHSWRGTLLKHSARSLVTLF